MTDKNNSQNSSQKDSKETREQSGDLNQVQKMNVNPDPRANENVKNIPFDKEQGIGSEITDGEGG